MRCLLEGWKVGRCVIVGMFLSNIPTVQLSAQVGHNPGTSPYHDIYLHSGPILFVGHLGGVRGMAGVGTCNELTLGARNGLTTGRAYYVDITNVHDLHIIY